jgi:hypothetical protein
LGGVLRLEGAVFRGLLGHAGFIRTF